MYDDMLKDLLESRARAWGELQKFVTEARARATDSKFTAEDQQEFERRSADLDDYDNRVKTLKDRVQGDKAADEYRGEAEKILRPVNREIEGDDDWVKQERSVAEFFTADAETIRSGRRPNFLEVSLRGLAIERDPQGRNIVHETRSLRPITGMVEHRTGLTVGSATAGGDLFNKSFRAVLYQHLIFNSAIRQTRATVLTTGSGENLLLPKTTSHPGSGTIVSEAAGIGETEDFVAPVGGVGGEVPAERAVLAGGAEFGGRGGLVEERLAAAGQVRISARDDEEIVESRRFDGAGDAGVKR